MHSRVKISTQYPDQSDQSSGLILPWKHRLVAWLKKRLSKRAFIKLLKRTSPEIINQAILQQDDRGYNILHSASYSRQSSSDFVALFEKASLDAIQKAILQEDRYGHNVMVPCSPQSI